MKTTPVSWRGKLGSPEGDKLEQIFRHFHRKFADDPIQAFARFFAKASHAACSGTGLLTYLRPSDASNVADLRLCSCARRRRDRFVAKGLRFEAARQRGGLEFAEATVCPEAELLLPRSHEEDERAKSDADVRA